MFFLRNLYSPGGYKAFSTSYIYKMSTLPKKGSVLSWKSKDHTRGSVLSWESKDHTRMAKHTSAVNARRGAEAGLVKGSGRSLSTRQMGRSI